MSNITINSDSPAKRCEICHQSDCFNPSTNECSRCATSKSAAKEPSPRKINVSVELGLKDMIGISDGRLLKTLANMIGVLGIVFMSLHLIFSFYEWKFYKSIFSSYMSLGFIAYFILLVGIIALIQYKTLKKGVRNQRYCFEEDSYEVSEEKNFARVSWDSLPKVKETSGSFFFFFQPGQAIYHMVPKRFFSSNEDIEQLRTIIKAKLGKKAKLLSKKTSFIYHSTTSLVIFLVGGACLLFLGINDFQLTHKDNLHNQAEELIFSKPSSKENYEKAEAILLNLEKEYPDDIEILHELAHYLVYEKEDYIGAEKRLLKILDNCSKCGEYQLSSANEMLGFCRLEQKDLDGAEKYFLASLAIYPDSWGSSLGLGDIAFERKDYQTAETYYLRNLAVSPKGISMRFKLANLYEITNRTSEAIAQYELIEELAKKDDDLGSAREAAKKKLKLKEIPK